MDYKACLKKSCVHACLSYYVMAINWNFHWSIFAMLWELGSHLDRYAGNKVVGCNILRMNARI